MKKPLVAFCQLSVVSCQLLVVSCQLSAVRAEQPDRAREVIAAAIEAMGGNNYLEIKNYHKVGRYFSFDDKGRRGYGLDRL
jgi:hypothetical protein